MKMQRQAKSSIGGRRGRGGRRGFTLIELILVMGLLAVVLTATSPLLRNFFRGRRMGEEARRILALTRYARSEAISRSTPMELWIDEAQKRYGLRPQTDTGEDEKEPVTFNLDENLTISYSPTNQRERREGVILFLPDGTVDEDESLEEIILQEGKEYTITIEHAIVGVGYEIRDEDAKQARRR